MFAIWKILLLLLPFALHLTSGQNICTEIGGIETQFINNPTSCSAWIACNNRKVVNIGNCDAGYYFDASVGACRSSSSTECTLSSLLNICRGESDGTYVANPQNCKGYFYCQNSIGFPGLCNTNYIFNGTLNQCVENPNYVCPNGGGNSLGAPTVGSNTPCDYFADNTFIASMSNCSNYNVCENNQALGGSCGPSLYFNPTTSSCDQPQNVQCSVVGQNSGSISVPLMPPAQICSTYATNSYATFVPDPASCNGYYYCPNGKYSTTAFQGNCPDDLWFDSASKTCAEQRNAYCVMIPCSGKPIGYFQRILFLCDAYYYCSASGAVWSYCPNGYYFDEKNQNCNSPSSVTCIKQITTTSTDWSTTGTSGWQTSSTTSTKLTTPSSTTSTTSTTSSTTTTTASTTTAS